MKAIKTVYRGPTNSRGSRIIATAEGGERDHRITISFPYEYAGMDAHAQAALALCKKMGWTGKLIGGGLRDCYVFVFAPRNNSDYGTYKIKQ